MFEEDNVKMQQIKKKLFIFVVVFKIVVNIHV
jgi:hypothetical protein